MLPSFRVVTPGVFILSAIIARKHSVHGQGTIECTFLINTSEI